MSGGRGRTGPDQPLVMSDVVRELQAIAAVAETAEDPAVVHACRRAQSLLARLQKQFLQDVIGDGQPSDHRAA